MNIAKCVMVLSQSFRKNTADGLNKSGTKLPKLYSQQHQQMDSISNSQNGDRGQSYFFKPTVKIIKFLSPLRNLIADSNSYQLWYLFGWATLCLIIAVYLPLLLVLLVIVIVIAPYIISNSHKIKLFITDCLKRIALWVNLNKIARIILAFLILIFGEILVLKYYPRSPFIESLIQWISSINWVLALLILCVSSFIIGFAVETYLIWKKDSKEINITLSILGAVSSFASLCCARWIFVYITGLEPTTFSRSLIILSAIIGIVLWILFSILILSLIYFLTVFIQTLTLPFNPSIYIPLIRNNTWFRFLCKKRKDDQISRKMKKYYINSFLFNGGRGLGSALLAFILFRILYLSFLDTPFIVNKYSWIQIVEDIIVYVDYRPDNKISECSNLEQGDWGLLAGYKKISVAKSQEAGGYIFTTKPCLFEDIIPNKQ